MSKFKIVVLSVIVLAMLSLPQFAGAQQYDWDKLTYYHSTGTATPDIQNSYQIELHESGIGKLEYTKYGKTTIYDFSPSRRSLNNLNRLISNSGLLDADTSDLRRDRSEVQGTVYLLTIFCDKPQGYKKRKHPVVIVQTNVADKYREKAFSIYEYMEGMVPTSVWEQAYADAEKNKGG